MRPPRREGFASTRWGVSRRSCLWRAQTRGGRRSRSSCRVWSRGDSRPREPRSRHVWRCACPWRRTLAGERTARSSLMADALDRVLACVDARYSDAVELLQELVQVNSVNPEFAGVRREDVIGGETRANEILRERYEQAGLEIHWVAPDRERRNLVGVRKGTRQRGPLARPQRPRGHRPPRRPRRLGQRQPVEPRDQERASLRDRFDGHEGLGHRDVAGRAGARRRRRRTTGRPAPAFRRRRGDDAARARDVRRAGSGVHC